MKFSEYLTKIEDVSIFPIISLIIFGTVFVIAALYAFTSNKKKMEENANIPLNDKNNEYEI
ncbi:MAG: cbb3-type cytochrome c oxidase subunit 3 [Brumimicrobium sp.]|nr:cbb3-type cytochrome c oxidase subunit 3 [Brumimicrobium sp.]MCO5268060.1 cbb3-type cytochrome c oxidase subunit 3 [Brumimicrobium sp.]